MGYISENVGDIGITSLYSYVCDIQFVICSCFYPNFMCSDSFYETFFKGRPKGQRGFTVLAEKILSAEKFQIESHCMKQTEFPWERYS